MGSGQPLVSVVMATYNEKPSIVQLAIRSILEQTYHNFELLIFDDSTKPETINAINEMSKDVRVKIHRFNERKGFVSSLNEGLRIAKGEFIARMDGDDYSYPERFEKELTYLSKNPNVIVTGGQVDIMNEIGEITSHRSYPLGGVKLLLFSCFRNPLAHPTIMMRREIIDKGYRYNESLKMSEDLDFWLRLINDGYTISNLNDTLLKFRVQDNFADKRVNDVQRKYMSDVRKANFSINNPIHGFLSMMAGCLFKHVPADLIKRIYTNENKRGRK